MNPIVIFALLVAVAGGAIAHFGDRLGTYVGKKRISRFGLRPRHTAMLYTIGSGVAISVLTLGFLVLTNSAFQRALVEGPQLISQNEYYQHQIKQERTSAIAAEARAQTATLRLSQVQGQLRPVQQQFQGEKLLLSHSQQALLQRQQQLRSAQAGLAGTNQKLRLARLDVQQAKRSLIGAEASVRVAQQRLVRQQESVDHLRATGKTLLAQNTALQSNNAKLENQRSLLLRRVVASSESLIFLKDQEIDRLVIKTAQPVTVIEGDLTHFLNFLSDKAKLKGGNRGENGRTVVIAVPTSADVYRPLTVVQEQEAVRALAQNIAGEPEGVSSVVVVARAATNTFLGEQTSIDLHPWENLLIYPKNAVVATATITGAQSDLQIVDALGAFLTEKVRPAVTSQGLIPQRDSTGKPIVGAVLDEATSQALVQQIGRLGGDAQVTAYASEDTYSSGPLHLRFRILPVGPVSSPRPPDAVGRRS